MGAWAHGAVREAGEGGRRGQASQAHTTKRVDDVCVVCVSAVVVRGPGATIRTHGTPTPGVWGTLG